LKYVFGEGMRMDGLRHGKLVDARVASSKLDLSHACREGFFGSAN
jgi:hypothetical protein